MLRVHAGMAQPLAQAINATLDGLSPEVRTTLLHDLTPDDFRRVYPFHPALIRTLIAHVPEDRRPALQEYLDRVDAGIARAFDDDDDRRDALEEDRQGLGLSRERRAS